MMELLENCAIREYSNIYKEGLNKTIPGDTILLILKRKKDHFVVKTVSKIVE